MTDKREFSKYFLKLLLGKDKRVQLLIQPMPPNKINGLRHLVEINWIESGLSFLLRFFFLTFIFKRKNASAKSIKYKF